MAGLFVCMAALVIVLRTVQKVRSEHGFDTFYDLNGAEWNYIGRLVLLALIPIALLIGYCIRRWELREERDFRKRFDIKE